MLFAVAFEVSRDEVRAFEGLGFRESGFTGLKDPPCT